MANEKKGEMQTVKSVAEARLVKGKVIYGIRSTVGKDIVYVGQSRLLFKRFAVHYYSPKNEGLAEWMQNNEWEMVILETNPIDLNKAESEWIKKLKPQLFNMVYGGEQAWRHHDRKPWMAGQNIRCPSDALFFWLKNRNWKKGMDRGLKDKLNELKSKMTDQQRVHYELSLAVEFYDFGGGNIRRKIQKWFSHTHERLEKFASS